MDQSGARRFALAIILLFAFCGMVVLASWGYTSVQLSLARSRGVYPTAEEGMLALVDTGYVGITHVDILYAGPDSFVGSQPHVWYVIAEVRASRRADGSAMGYHGCDAPGSFFIQSREGWVHVPEGAFPEFIGLWMEVFGLAGRGESAPSTDWAPSQPERFCQST